jgi:colanic acid/amylovoran biosynthesis protein
MMAGYDDTSDGGSRLDSVSKVIEQVGRCRLVITGSYHAGVFALSQGIPVLGLAKSQYFFDKFRGLSGQFGQGCGVIDLEREGFGEKLRAEAHALWERAAELRPQLLQAASVQITQSRAAYRKLYGMCGLDGRTGAWHGKAQDGHGDSEKVLVTAP